ncbi:antibiotic biosynthesis monooxygenase [Maribacter sp. ANRC-HE7]|uniref:Antibiotic biosynthesis monooxygenase n=1 Tax=Maribacter aquimaris TaxID=2737171 RepID=A0ABR7UW88_9FLAO|nr:antibiotic biosynthesis monooxygenase [Maribacter aquimaris]MBD0776668.1 antibiotic biosynthesis monooxygenase [Maribacter aquimaris]
MKSTIVKFTAKPEHATSFAATLKEAQAATQKEAGNKEIKIFVSKADANVFFVYERWADKAAITSHDNEPHTQKLMQVGQTALQTAPDFYFLGDTNPLPDHSNSANPEDEVFIIFFIFKFNPSYRKQILAQFEDHITNTRKEEKGNILFDLYTVDDHEDTLAVYEHWRKESDVWDIHFNQPYAMKTGKLLEEAVDGDLKQYMNFVTEI